MNLEPISNSLWDRADFMLLIAFFWLIECLSIMSIDGMCREEEVLLFTVFLFVMGLFLKKMIHIFYQERYFVIYMFVVYFTKL